MIDIPLGLRNAIDTQNCVLFVGAGIGLHLKKPDGSMAPNGRELCELMYAKFKIDHQPNSTLSQISEIVQLRYGRKELESFLSLHLGSLTPDDVFQWISTVRWRSIFTTNYDNCIERAYQLNPKPPQNPVSFSVTSDSRSTNILVDVPIYHVHGFFLSGDSPNIIITKTDYTKFRERRRMLFEKLKFEMGSASLLYVGYSNTDPNWEALLEETIEDFYPTELPQSFRIDPYINELDDEILKSKNIISIKCEFKDFVETCLASNIGIHSGQDIYKNAKSNVPPELLAKFDTAPASIIRLLSSWEYVNQTKFNETPNLRQFLRGDFPNWSLISEGHYFERDVQNDLYDVILDFATTPKSKARIAALLGSAGYGISTMLRILSVQIIKENAGAVFFLKPGAELVEGDVLFASTLFENVFFVVDNCPQYAVALERVLHLLRESGYRAMLIVGGRMNEWHQSLNRPKAIEFPIYPLSDPEIERILEYLAKNNALSKIEELPHQMQFDIIKERHHKELLVVMSETIENNNFDAIIESEYRGIKCEQSKLAYLYICGFYQHGAYIRDNLLSDLLGISISDMYQLLKVPTEGVIISECIDENKGIFGSRARHHKIAAIVWERCADASQKDTLIQVMLRGLNLNFGTDARAFDQFVRSDRIVDCIRTLEGKIHFFEQACKMDPTSPYVRQHYARMLLRADQYPLALQQIESAIDKDKNVLVLHHTKGKILSQLAMVQDSLDIGRKYLIQAESCYNKSITLNTRDSYGFESLASLFFAWSSKIENFDRDESLDYFSKAEVTISNGLKTVRNRESLWVLSSKMASHLGKTPQSIARLETAIREQHNANVARYVLARAYRNQNQPDKAIEVLEPIVKSNVDDFRPLIEFALALVDTGESYRKAISILEHGTLYGLSDARFISVYGGMLYLDGRFDKADDVFQFAIKNVIPGDELYRINFRPNDLSNQSDELKIEGTIVKVQAGSSLIKPDSYPQIVCPATKYKGTIMKYGIKVSYTLAFSAKGPIAMFPQLLK
ncbi:MAG: SIR2 family protein [Bacteroidales bacterium]|nr:SIR2 family protein [Bacteroidales bacterium]